MRDLGVGDRLDRYEITDLLARSGMASTFKALDLDSGRAVALKVPYLQYESDVVFHERFRREEEIGRRLDHPHIVRVLAPRERSRVYLAMEYVEGRSLRSLLDASGTLPADRALVIARELCEAVSYLDENGVAHRDVKPENVLLAMPEGTVKLFDFGIALLRSARRLTWGRLSNMLGTPDYMAPEQIRGRRGDGRTDVYAVGTILYEMLAGSLPYDAPNVAALLRAKTHREPTPLRERVRGIPPVLEGIVLTAIARDPRHRYGSAEEMLRDLRDPSAVVRAVALRRARSPGAPLRPGRALVTSVLSAAGLVSRAWGRARHGRPAEASGPDGDAEAPERLHGGE